VAKDTARPKRQKIIDAYNKVGFNHFLDRNDITGLTKGLDYRTVSNELQIMEVLGILSSNEHGQYGFTEDFKPYLGVLYNDLPITSKKNPENGLFSELTKGSVYSSTSFVPNNRTRIFI
jgi:hypothetical protein